MEAPKSLKQLCGFIGIVNYCRDMWPHRAHILAPLTSKIGAPQRPKRWETFQIYLTPEMQTAFDQMKALMAMDVLCTYSNHNKPFHICTNTSNCQLGSCIMQDGQPVAYYSKKLNNSQHNYFTVVKKLLSIVMTLHEWILVFVTWCWISLSYQSKNVLHIGDSSQCRLRWISYIDEYGSELH